MWKQVPGHPRYEVSDTGRARRGTKEVGLKVANTGYRRIWMDGKEYALHRVILETFVGPAPKGALGRHLNDVRTDNRLENLAWGTQKENMADMERNSGHYLSRRSTCKRGHELTPDPNVDGRRYCPECKRTWGHRTGRHKEGYIHARKLTQADVDSMRAEYRQGVRGEYSRLGRKYGISSTQAGNILKGKQWKGNSAPGG